MNIEIQTGGCFEDVSNQPLRSLVRCRVKTSSSTFTPVEKSIGQCEAHPLQLATTPNIALKVIPTPNIAVKAMPTPNIALKAKHTPYDLLPPLT